MDTGFEYLYDVNNSASEWTLNISGTTEPHYNVTNMMNTICDSNFANPYVDFSQIYPVRAILVFLYITTALIAFIGNFLVIVTVCITAQMHSKTNYYIVNLAVSDLCVALVVLPLKLLEYTSPCSWQVFSNVMCSTVTFLQPIFVFTTILTLMVLSIERYNAIVHPLSRMRHNSKSRTRKIIAATWIIPIMVSWPYLFSETFAVTFKSDYGVMSRQICQDTFYEIDAYLSADGGLFRTVFFFVIFSVMFFIPACVVVATCFKIAMCLSRPAVADGSPHPGSISCPNYGKQRRKVARMVIVIAIAYIICWSPIFVVSIVSQLQEVSFLKRGNFIFTMLVVHLSGFVNSCMNPIVYAIMSKSYRQSFRNILTRILLCDCSKKKSKLHTHSAVSRSIRKPSTILEMNGMRTLSSE